MDIHRSRFVPYPSSAINALAFSHSESEHGHGNKDSESLRLAIGRANGNIEIWNPNNGAWLQEKVLYGGKERSVEGLAWTQEPNYRNADNKMVLGSLRLFSIGYSSSVTEWDLATGLPARHSSGNHSEVWCFAVQPRQCKVPNPTPGLKSGPQQKLVAGCADGTVVLLSTEDDDLTFDRFVSRATNKKARALSITYQNENIVLAGFADSMIRVFDTRNGNVIRNISLGSGPHGGPREILVWKVKCLSNGDFVSGDSTGEIRFYHGKNYSQTQRISGHEADVLDLAVSRDGTTVFSAGMDRRTCIYSSRKSAVKVEGQHGKWRKVSHKRYHEHDVKAMATYEGVKLSVVVTGGIDTQPIVMPLGKFDKELSRGLPALPSSPPLASAPDARLLVSWWNTELRIWRVKPQADNADKPRVVARLALQGEENISSVSISQDGGLLAASTPSTVKLFQLLQPRSGAGGGLRIRKLEMPDLNGAKSVKLSPNGKWLAAINATNAIQIVRIVRSEDEADLPRALDKTQHLVRFKRQEIAPVQQSGLSQSYGRTIAHAEFSADGNVFAVADITGYIDTWIIEGHEDSTAPEVDIDDTAPVQPADEESDDEDEEEREIVTFLGQHWAQNPSGHLMPQLDSTPVLLSFQPQTDDITHPQPNGNPALHPTRHNPHPHSHELPNASYCLLVVTVDHRMNFFDVMKGRLSEWSRRNQLSSYPPEYLQLDLPAKGCIWDINEAQQRIWLYGEKWLFMFDLTKDFAVHNSDEAALSKKRKRGGAGDIKPRQELPVTKMRKFGGQNGPEKGNWTDVNANGRDETDEEDLEADDSQSLAVLRSGSTQEKAHANGEMVSVNGEKDVEKQKRGHSGWHTFKYRPILGILPIGPGGGQTPEVVLVERPSWDLDLPPRFVGTHEQS